MRNDGDGAAAVEGGDVVVFVAADGIGRGDEELGWGLMQAFLGALAAAEPRPRTVALMNSGVKLAIEGHRGVEPLAALAAAGTEILSCGTCLDYFGVREQLAVGQASNMVEITGRLLTAGHVVRP
jgi:selenium metabolism protein YedF